MSAQPIKKIDDLRLDQRNANRGTERGDLMLERSLQKYGAGRSILVDKKGTVIAGNKTLVKAGEIGIEDVVVVQTDGSKIVAVQRMDLDLAKDNSARELALADNRISEVDLEWDLEQIARDLEDGLDLSDFWAEDELDQLIDDAIPEWTDGEMRDLNRAKDNQYVSPLIHVRDVKTVERAFRRTGEINRADAFLKICRHYLDEEG